MQLVFFSPDNLSLTPCIFTLFLSQSLSHTHNTHKRYFNGNLTTQFRGEAHFDGGISNFLPRLPNVERNVGVCCFPAGQMGALSSRVQLAPDTFEPWPYGFRKMLAWALTPAPDEMMVSLMEKGKRDSLQWCKEYKESLLILPLPEEEQPAGSGVILPSSSSTVPANSSVEP